MNANARHLSGVSLSLAVHGLLAGVLFWLWRQQPPPPEPEPIRWEISLFTPPPPTPPAPAPEPTPQPVVAPTPPPPQPVVSPPKPKPEPKPKAKPKPKPKPPPKPVTRYLREEPVDAPETPPAPQPAAPAPSAAPAPAAPRGPLADVPPAPKEQPDFDWLKRYLVEHARASKRYPPEARRNEWEGRVVVKFTIGSNGALLRAAVVKSSGHEILDEEALATLRRITPVPVSSTHRWSEVSLSMPFDYKLNR